MKVPGLTWWRRRRWELAQQQLLAGMSGDVQLEVLAQEQPLFAGAANEHRFLRSLSRARTTTTWRGD
jgi:anti-sigma factor RsiW